MINKKQLLTELRAAGINAWACNDDGSRIILEDGRVITGGKEEVRSDINEAKLNAHELSVVAEVIASHVPLARPARANLRAAVRALREIAGGRTPSVADQAELDLL